MKKTVDRQYVLSPEEVQRAIVKYLTDIDEPGPADYKDIKIAWNANGELFASFTDIRDPF